jgi:hypothetical protein
MCDEDQIKSYTHMGYISYLIDNLNFTKIENPYSMYLRNIHMQSDFYHKIKNKFIDENSYTYIKNASQIDMNSMYPAFAIAAESIMQYCKYSELKYCRFPKMNAKPKILRGVLYIPAPTELVLYELHCALYIDYMQLPKEFINKVTTYIFKEGDWQLGVEYRQIMEDLYTLKKEDNGPFSFFVKQILVCWFGKLYSLKLGYDYAFIYAYTKTFMNEFKPVTDKGCGVVVDSFLIETSVLDNMILMHPYMFGTNIGQFKIEVLNAELYYVSSYSYMFVKDKKIIKTRGRMSKTHYKYIKSHSTYIESESE